jgi:hypothetical protein
MNERDAYWDDLGIAWTATRADVDALGARLKGRLLWQRLATMAVLFAGVPVAIAGAALGGWTIWLGESTGAWNFVIRGIAILSISLLAGFAAWSFKSALRDDSESLSAMIALALLRARRWRRALLLGYVGCGVAAVLGTVGYGVRVHLAGPPALPPYVPLALLAWLGCMLFLLHRRTAGQIAKYRYLQRRLIEEP